MVSEARASNNIGLLPDHSGGGEVILSFTSQALQPFNCMLVPLWCEGGHSPSLAPLPNLTICSLSDSLFQ